MKNHGKTNLQKVKKCKLFEYQIIVFIVCDMTLFNSNSAVLHTIIHSN